MKRILGAAAIAATLALIGPQQSALAADALESLVVEIRQASPSLAPAAIRALVTSKLGVHALSPDDPAAKDIRDTLTVTFRHKERQLVVSYRSPTGIESSEIAQMSDDTAMNAASIASMAEAITRGRPKKPGAEPNADAREDRTASGSELPTPNEAPEPPRPALSSLPYFPFNLSLIYPIALNAGRPAMRTNLDIALLVSRVGAVSGLSTGVLTYALYDMRGAQASVAALASGDMTGVQIGAAFAFADGPVAGVQVAGILGWASGPVWGAQLAGIAGQSFEDVHGLQLSGGVSIARAEVRGVQAAGLVNIGRVRGLQIGLVNVSAEVTGVQVGLFNLARKVDGLQVGLINLARETDGFPVGLINITEALAGESVGLANILGPGAIHLSIWGSNSLNGNAGLKFSSKYIYSILSGAVHAEDKKPLYGLGFALGIHMPRLFSQPSLWLSSDLGVYRLFRGGFTLSGHDEMLKARTFLSFEIARRLTLFAGGGAYVGFRGNNDVAVGAGPEGFGGVDF